MENKMKKEVGSPDAPKDIRISMSRQKAMKERRKRASRLMIIMLVLCVTAIVVVLALFLKVDKIEVNGNIKHSAQDIIASSGINVGDSIITVGGSQTEKNIKDSFPSIEKVDVKKRFPSVIQLNIRETDEVMFISVGQQYNKHKTKKRGCE